MVLNDTSSNVVFVKLLHPSNGDTVSGTVPVVASVYGDTEGGTLKLLIDSVEVASTSEAHLAYKWHTDTLENESVHFIRAEFTKDGNTYPSDEISVMVLNDTITITWSKHIVGAIFSSVGVDNSGNLYVGSDDSYVYALDSNGNILWSYKTGGSVYSAISIDDNGNIYFGSDDGYVYSLDNSGNLRWRFKTNAPVYSSVAIAANSNIYVGSCDSCLYSLDNQGNLLWRKNLNGAVFSTPAITSNGNIWVATDNGTIYLLSSNGDVIYSRKLSYPVIASLSIGKEDEVYIGTYGGDMITIFENGAFGPYANLNEGIVHASIIVGNDGAIYVISTVIDQKLYSPVDIIKGKVFGTYSYIYAFNASSYGHAQERFVVMVPSMILSTPLITSDNKLIVGSVNGELLIISPDGAISKKIVLSNSPIKSPITLTSDGNIYVGAEDGYLYSLKTPLKPAYEGWPQFGFNSKHIFRRGQ